MPAGIPAGTNISPQQIRQYMQNVPNAPALLSAARAQGEAGSGEVSAAEGEGAEGEGATAEQKVDTLRPAAFSSIEQLYRQQYNSPLARSLTQYGYNLFQTSTNYTSKLAVPGDSYIIGPGDKLRIRIWGNGQDAAYTGTVRRDGTIDVPQIGIIPVAGTPFGKLEDVFRSEAEKYIQGINLSVSLAELRSVEIYVIGEVSRPGLHLVPPFSTVIGGLISGGGVKKSGSLRTIKLFRDGTLVQVVDLYTLLLYGSREQDLPLQDGDVLFVPRIGPTAAVAGAVLQPAIYELTSEKTAADLLELAGGALPQTFTRKLLLRRFVDNQEFVIKDIDQRSGSADLAKVSIQNGDLLELQYLGATWPEVVRLEGNVWAPDIFKYRPGLKLSDILTDPSLLKPDSIIEFGLLHRYDPQTTRYRVERFPLARVFQHDYDAELAPYDRLEILSRKEYNIKEPVQLMGSVWRPGEYTYTPGLTLGDLLGMAGGFRFEADTGRIDLSRQEIRNGEVTTINKTLSADTNGDFPLQPYDYIYVRHVKDAASFKSVSITGEVKFPGTYRIRDGERLSDLIERAGGFTDKAYFYGAYFVSAKAKLIQQKSINKMIDDLELRVQSVLSDKAQTLATDKDAALIAGQQQALKGLIGRLRQVRATGRMSITLGPLASIKGTDFDFELHEGDSLHVPQKPNFVSVVGSVYNANSFLYRENLSLKDYLDRAGGPTKTADRKAVYVVKANGEVLASSQGSFFNSFWNYKPMPGDTVVVPENLDRLPYMQLIGNISDILFKIATTAGIIFAI
ncbi:sugar ABC transporter substrate-binding protein [Desulfolithobacter dissulfuricans]|uniref:Sugar ABC transporter substrate-binding protein n=2 Tax=Desulfolithobacter dissulfuricans TaxID=2795293 RepID=A0A915XIE0_9BACT|nr:sugar ABC transporter substrate-binding protein [Desulfolithobacter dissulfuricans]